MSKGISTILLIVIILAVGIIGASIGYYYGANSATTTTQLVTVAKTTAPKITTTAVGATTTAVDTANWKTYTNTRYGFTLKYPSDWKLTAREINENNPEQIAYITNQTGDAYLGAGEANIDINYKKGQSSSDTFSADSTKALKDGETSKIGEAIINGVKVSTYIVASSKPIEGSPGKNIRYYFDKGGDTIYLSLTIPDKESSKVEPITTKIINTFKFTP